MNTLGVARWVYDGFPDPREDLESSSPNSGPILLRVLYRNPPLRDLLFGSFRRSGLRFRTEPGGFKFGNKKKPQTQRKPENAFGRESWVLVPEQFP